MRVHSTTEPVKDNGEALLRALVRHLPPTKLVKTQMGKQALVASAPVPWFSVVAGHALLSGYLSSIDVNVLGEQLFFLEPEKVSTQKAALACARLLEKAQAEISTVLAATNSPVAFAKAVSRALNDMVHHMDNERAESGWVKSFHDRWYPDSNTSIAYFFRHKLNEHWTGRYGLMQYATATSEPDLEFHHDNPAIKRLLQRTRSRVSFEMNQIAHVKNQFFDVMLKYPTPFEKLQRRGVFAIIQFLGCAVQAVEFGADFQIADADSLASHVNSVFSAAKETALHATNSDDFMRDFREHVVQVTRDQHRASEWETSHRRVEEFLETVGGGRQNVHATTEARGITSAAEAARLLHSQLKSAIPDARLGLRGTEMDGFILDGACLSVLITPGFLPNDDLVASAKVNHMFVVHTAKIDSPQALNAFASHVKTVWQACARAVAGIPAGTDVILGARKFVELVTEDTAVHGLLESRRVAVVPGAATEAGAFHVIYRLLARPR